MNDQPKPIQVDYQGQPITSGIPVRNNAEYVAKVGTMILILHFIFHPVAIVFWSLVGIFGALCMTPGAILVGLYSNHVMHSMAGGIIGYVLLGLGFCVWVYYTVRWTKRLAKWFIKHTKMRYVGQYRGPATPVTDYLERERQVARQRKAH